MNPPKYFFHAGIKKFLSRQNSDPWRGYKGPEDLPFRASLLSESQRGTEKIVERLFSRCEGKLSFDNTRANPLDFWPRASFHITDSAMSSVEWI
jgi:hypothetical protein